MLRKAKSWLRERGLPITGFVLFTNGHPWGWERYAPDPSKVIPGVVSLSIADGIKQVAIGGTPERGARQWGEYAN